MSIFWLGSIFLFSLAGLACQADPVGAEAPAAMAAYQEKMAVRPDAEPTATQAAPVKAVGAQDTPQVDVYGKIKEQVPDPLAERALVSAKIDNLNADDQKQKAELRYLETIISHMNMIDREQKVELSLAEVIQRALDNSYNIRVQSYNPAISATNVVEAEAVFDMIFFSNAIFSKNNTPTTTTLSATDSTNRIFNTGVSKLLPTGMTTSVTWTVVRNEFDSAFAFSTLNPAFTNAIKFQVRQPFLRGFGIDFNRSQINVTSNDRRISQHAFERGVQDHLLNTEEAYWRLVAARRNLVIEARLIAEFQKIYLFLKAREDFDATPVEITQAKARLDSQVANFARVKQNVLDAEDSLKNFLNDPSLNLVDGIEIVPNEFLTAEPVTLDRLAELQAALDNRQELMEAELGIESARINVGVAKNRALPRFDVTFDYTYDSLGKSQHDAFQNLSDLDFHNYRVQLEFEWPIGNRGARAALIRARRQHAQALAALKQQIEAIILEVNVAIREMNTNYEQIDANMTAVQSQIEQVEAIRERAEKMDPNQLNRELGAIQGIASARQGLLVSLQNYNVAISRLERAKGTLLDYNNVVVGDADGNR
jgi:outer membrane protein TolC